MRGAGGGGEVSTPNSPAGPGTPRYGMVVDLNRCVGCQTCTIACKHHNDTPPGVQWRRVLDVEQGEYPNVERLFLVTGCQHCAEPPCVPVCPTGATRQRADGLVTMDYDTCIGCGYCAVACPYQARTIAHDYEWYYGVPSPQEERAFDESRMGVASKCTFCVDKIDDAAKTDAVPGLDLEHTPACASSCIAQALHFGDFADPDSNVSRLAQANANFQMHAELGTDPQIRYLYEVPETTPGRDGDPADVEGANGSEPNDPLVGERQTFWDFRAAMNFTLGGMSSGLAVAAFLVWALGGVPDAALPWFFAAAAAGMGVGLIFVFAEIGRPARFLYVLRRPQSSWMTRETYAVAVFYPAVAANLVWPSPALHVLVAVAAAAFLYCQGRILHAGRGIPTWRHPLVPRMLVATGLHEGVALLVLVLVVYLVGSGLTPAEGSIPASESAFVGTALAVLAGIGLAAANAALFRALRRGAAEAGIGPLSRRDLDAIAGRMRWLGYLLPIAFFAGTALAGLVLLVPAAAIGPQCTMAESSSPACGILESVVIIGTVAAPLALVAGAACAVAGGALLKYTLVTRACHQQGFSLPRVPQRGSGARAAPARYGLP